MMNLANGSIVQFNEQLITTHKKCVKKCRLRSKEYRKVHMTTLYNVHTDHKEMQ